MSTDETAVRRELLVVEQHLAQLTEQAERVKARRDQLVRELCDSTGCASSRPVGVR